MIMATHNEALINSLCDSAIWLRQGEAHWFDSSREALAEYNKSLPQ
jgi:capsular polysaccharide transport system ATP-binding protein